MAVLPDDDVGEVRSRVAIEELIRDYNVALLPSGAKRFRALCPFHREKTPSFYVDVEKQFYHCFGCKEGGDIFTFVEKMDHVGFPEALEILARKAGVALRRRGGPKEPGDGKLALFDALSMAEEFYHRILLEDSRGAPARKYLEGRRIQPEMWKRFRLGYSPPEWDALLKLGAARRLAPELLERVGLLRQREGGSGYYDYFRGRLMFPICDVQRRVIGFGGRALSDEDTPKYLNTPKTPLFEKGQVLYGLPQARAAIHREGRIAIMEGYTDAIMAHQEGLDHAVASLGTAFTAENARRLRRLFAGSAPGGRAPGSASGSTVARVELIFDGDASGQNASERSLDLLVAEELDVRVYTVQNGKDPCDALLELGGAEFRRRVEAESVDIFEFKWKRTVGAARQRGEGPAGVARALDEVVALLEKVPNSVTRKLQVKRLAERIGLDEAVVESRLGVFPPRSPRGDGGVFPDQSGAFPPRPPRGGGGVFPLRGGGGELPLQEGVSADAAGSGQGPVLEEILLECLIAEPELARRRYDQVGPGRWPFGEPPAGESREPLPAASGLRPIASALERQLAGGAVDAGALLASLRDEEARAALVRILARLEQGRARSGSAPFDREETWKSCLRDLERKSLERREKALERAKAQARERGDTEGLEALRREQLDVLRRLKGPTLMNANRTPPEARRLRGESEKGNAW
jgi:DNA primase catalytic core